MKAGDPEKSRLVASKNVPQFVSVHGEANEQVFTEGNA